ncbi:hypothetical protein SCHPADRAFT_903327 [Schizopora paradoxa]|uniref:CsbD-like domain-containing protein n=1 Tax=Schizopora paradoxa TaxID=27342 RepID=A0A0H2RR68_9AGAM|nr:hypothetical protein SCHPADRAFT_903327 [Schizopora paradoxa]
MQARGILHKGHASSLKQREQFDQQQQLSGPGTNNTDSYGNRANGAFDSDGTQMLGANAGNEPPLPPRKDQQQGNHAADPAHADNMNGENNQHRQHQVGDNQHQQHQHMNGGRGEGAAAVTGNAGQPGEQFDKPSDAYSSANQTTTGGTDASRYDQQRMEAPPKGGSGNAYMRDFTTPSDAMQAGATHGAPGAGSGPNATTGQGAVDGGHSGHGHHHVAGPAAAAGAIGATEAATHGQRGTGQGVGRADNLTGHRGYNQDQNRAGDQNFGGGRGYGQNAGGPAPGAAGGGEGAMNAGPNDTTAGAGGFDQNHSQRAQERNFGANAGIGSGAGHENVGRHAMGPAAAVGAAGLDQNGGHGRTDLHTGPGRAGDQAGYDAENNLPVDGHATGVNPTTHGGAAPLSSAPGSGSVASGSGTAQVVIGTLQQAAGTLLNNDNMIAKGLERESKGMAKRDPGQAQALQQEADITRSQGRH